jgi:parvulin-like peptidyl-prolyl isomerase
MTRMRESMPVILFGLLIAFLITIIFEWGMDYLGIRGGHGDVIGKINGKKVTYREFSDLLKNFTDQAKTQSGKEPDEEQTRMMRDQAWQTLVNQNIVEEQIKKLGLSVTDQELIDWVRGPNPPEDLRRYFVDSTGQFRRDAYEQFLSSPNQFLRDPNGRDPEFGSKWLADYEKGLRQRRLNEKLQSLVLASVRVSEGELRQRFIDQNQRASALYALFDVSAVKDQDVQVTDADLKAYYDDNIDQFKVDATRKLKYVVFKEAASAADSSMKRKDIEEAAAQARGGTDFLQLVSMYSDRPDSGAWYHHGELLPHIEAAAFSAQVGDVVGPVEDADGYRLVKVLEERAATGEYIRASHILLPVQGQMDTAAVKRQAEAVAREARQGRDFAQLARENSKDLANAERGGDLGWFTHGRMVAQFEKAAFAAKVGEIVGPVRTPFGWHIIKVTGRDKRELKLATISAHIEASSQTKNDLFDRARDFAYNARESEFTKEAKQTGLDVGESQVQEKSTVVPGLGVNDAIVRFAFSSKVGAVSEPYQLSGSVAVVTVTEAKDAGVRPFDEVKESLRPAVLRKKKVEKAMQIAADVRSKLSTSDSLTRVEQVDPSAKVQRTGEFIVGMGAPGVGSDPAFKGVVEAIDPGKVSPPIQGQRGAYLIQVASRTPFDSSAYATQRENLQTRLLAEKKSRFLSEWLAKLRETAEVEDHRDLFFR